MAETTQQNNIPKKQMRAPPINELDLQLMTTDGVWGKPEVTTELINLLKKEGKTDLLWAYTGIYTRDLRLGNLSENTGELFYVRYFYDLALDFLVAGYPEPCIKCLSLGATVTESSHAKGGFFRKLMNTFRQESVTTNIEPPKKGLFGSNKPREGG